MGGGLNSHTIIRTSLLTGHAHLWGRGLASLWGSGPARLWRRGPACLLGEVTYLSLEEGSFSPFLLMSVCRPNSWSSHSAIYIVFT